MKIPKNLGMLLLAIWLIAMGAIPLFGIHLFDKQDMVLHILAIAAGVLLIMGR